MSLADSIRSPRPTSARRAADVVFILACLGALSLYLYLGSGLTFARDEVMANLTADLWTLETLMTPWNEHWALLQRFTWKVLMATVGLRSYMPYLFIDLLFHVVIAAGIYVYARRQTYPLIALAVSVLFLFLGSGGETYFLAFQMGWTAAAAGGTWALVLLLREPRPRHTWLAAVLLLLGVMTFGGIGLIFVAGATALVVASPMRRSLWWVVVPALAAYAAWYLLFGTDSIRGIPDPAAIIAFMRDGMANAIGHLTGMREQVGLVLAVLLGVAAIGNLVGGERVRLGLIAGTAALATQWAITAVARAGVAPHSFIAERYVHVSAILVLIAFVGWLGHRRLVERGEHARLVIGVAAVGLLALGWNVASIFWFHGHWDRRADNYRAATVVLTRYGDTPAIPGDHWLAYEDGPMELIPTAGPRRFIPGKDRLDELIARYGSPLDDFLALRSTAIPVPVLDKAFAEAVAKSVVIGVVGAPTEALPFDIVRPVDVDIGTEGDCRTITPSGPSPRVEIVVPSGSRLVLGGDGAGPAEIRLSLNGTYRAAGHRLETRRGAYTAVDLPDVGADVILRVALTPPPSGTTTLCLTGAKS